MSRYRSSLPMGRDGFSALLRAEWTKFRSVRGWVVGVIAAMLLTALVGMLPNVQCSNRYGPCKPDPVGPGGEAVTDQFFFVHRTLDGSGAITVRVDDLTGSHATHPGGPGGDAPARVSGLEDWSKAGIIVKDGTRSGSAYAAIMVTGGHGVRFQANYTQDVAGLPGPVSPVSPRWLRLTRSGDTVTGADSADGSHWTTVGTATLTGLPSAVQAGMFATSPAHQVLTQSLGSVTATGGPSEATAGFDHIGLTGGWSGGAWTGTDVHGDQHDGRPGAVRQTGGTVTVTGSGDIAPAVAGESGVGASITLPLVGTFFGLTAMVIIGVVFATAEYRRGLIRTTLTASPRRGRVLAAKAVVIGGVTFVAGLIASTVALLVGVPKLAAGMPIDPVAVSTQVRVVVGTAAMLAVAALLGLAVGVILRRGAGAVTAVIVAIVLPYLLSVIPSVLPATVQEWLLRITPAAGFAVQQAYPRFPQVDAPYSIGDGYYPLPPVAGFAVLCGYAAVAIAVARYLLSRRDA